MIKAKVFWQGKRLIGFDLKGHADYAPEGKDIVCAAVSVLAITTVNSLLEQIGQVLVKRHAAVRLTIAVGAVRQQDGVGKTARVHFDQPSVRQPLAQRGHPVGRPPHAVKKTEKKRQPRRPARSHKIGRVHLNGRAYIRVLHGAEEGQMLFPGKGVQVNDAVTHGACPFLTGRMRPDNGSIVPQRTGECNFYLFMEENGGGGRL